MLITLKNEQLELTVNSFGAEMNALKDSSGKDILWTGNPDVWKFHAPVLFPHCGKIKDAFVLIENKSFPLKSNGFARDLEFSVINQSENSVVFELVQNEYTLERFPYKFSLQVKYELINNQVFFESTVKNTDEKEFLFSIGSHSGFCCPRNEGESIEDYQIEFEKKEPLETIPCYENGFLANDLDGKCPFSKLYGEVQPGIIPLKADYFGNGHLFTNITSDWVGLRNKIDNSLIKVNTKNYPNVMLWQNAGKPHFICIEPWYGMPDPDNTNHQWTEKPGLVSLLPGKSFSCNQSIWVE